MNPIRSLGAIFVLLVPLAAGAQTPVKAWHDDFAGPTLDSKSWSYNTGNGMADYGLMDWGNGEQESYQKGNVSLVAAEGAEDGRALALTAKKERPGDGKVFTSGRIHTKDKVWVMYGKVEARIKAPVSRGLWPAFWMLGAGYPNSPGWPACGEIDIAELKGGLAPKTVYGTMHFGHRTPDDWYFLSGTKDASDALDQDWHIYGLEWTKAGLKWTLDGQVYHEETWGPITGKVDSKGTKIPSFDPAQMRKPYFLILQLAVGGGFVDGQAPRDRELPATMLVDWVRVSPL